MENITIDPIAILEICDIKKLPVSNASKLNFLINGVFGIILSILIILFNGAVLRTMFKVTSNSNLGANKTLLMVLSIVDFVSGCTHIPLKGLMAIQFSMDIVDCTVYKSIKILGYATTLLSAFIILCISCEYYLSLVKPLLRSKKQDTYFAIQLVVIFLIILVTSILFHGVYPDKSSLFVFISAFVLLVVYVCICTLYVMIYREMGRMRKRSLSSYAECKTLVRNLVRKTLKMLIVIALVFAICFVPFIMLSMYEAICGESAFTMNFVRIWCDSIANVNAIVDPIVYCLRLKSIRDNCWPLSLLRRRIHKKCLTISNRKVVITKPAGGWRCTPQTPFDVVRWVFFSLCYQKGSFW